MIPINKRSIGACIILSLITFGIYSIYWEYLLVKNTRAVRKDDSSCTGEMLCLLFVPFYSLYWWFTRGKLVRDEFSKHGFSASSNETAFLVLALFGLGIVAMAIMQNDFNSLPSESTQSDQRSAALLNGVMVVGTVLGVLLSVVLFIYLPKLLFNLLSKAIGLTKPELSAPYGERYKYQMIVSAFTGIIKIAIFVAYMAAVSMMKDIKRTFMYHGAEHKTIFCYEKGLSLTVENIREQSRFHPRCGTSFLIVMLLISIIIGFFVPLCADWLYVVIKLLLVPLAVGVGYEFIKFAGKHDNWIVKVLSAPGLWMQRISTKEPTDDMIECAIAAMNEVIPEDGSDTL